MFVIGLQLIAHPDTSPHAVRGVTCSLSWQDAGNWVANFIVAAPPSALTLPPMTTPARADGLWRRTCFELFLGEPDSAAYREYNFSPSGEWAAYAFDGYRDGMRALAMRDPWITSTDPDQFASGIAAHLTAIGLDSSSIEALLNVPMPDLPMAPEHYALNAHLEDATLDSGRGWRLGVSAVIEEVDDTKSYWALAHAPGPPDFHNRDCFIATLPAPERS